MTDTIKLLNNNLPEDYIVLEQIDDCGQGYVFKGKIQDIDVAFKFFKQDVDIERVKREIQLLKEIDSEYIVKVINNFNIDFLNTKIEVIAYEYLDGKDLRSLLTTQPSIEEIVDIGLHVSLALEKIWNRPMKRIVHRDIKPANIIKTKDGRKVLVDFGFARFVDFSDLTSAGKSPGTIGYKSPEQSLGKRNLTIKSDIFSLGVTLFHITTGEHPFDYDQNMILRDPPKDINDFRKNIPTDIVKLINSMMNKIPFLRPNELSEKFERIKGML